MDVKPNYKLTEVGVIPEDWAAEYLGKKTIKVGSGITPRGGKKVYREYGRPFIRSQNVDWGQIQLNDIVFIDEHTHATFKSTEVQKDDVFLNITGASIGRSAVADTRVEGGNVNQHVCIIRTIENELYPSFLNYFLLSGSGQRQIESFQAGGNRQGLNFRQIRSFILPLPPIQEQRAIATVLSDVDALLTKLDALIAKKRNLKQAAMQQLLTGQSRLPGFSGNWEIKQLGEVLKVHHGKSQHNIVSIDGAYPILATGGEIGRTNHYLYNKPSVLIGRKGTIDSPQYIETPFWTIDTLYYTEISSMASVKFIFYKLKTIKWRSYNEASGVPSLNTSTIENIQIELPSLAEQRSIATILSDMDAEIAALETRRDKIQLLKQGMMQELLTGRIRLR